MNALIVAVVGILLHQPSFLPELQSQKTASPEVKRDLSNLQGEWETTIRTRDQIIRNVQTIKGTTSEVERFDEDGNLLHSHTAQFKLTQSENVRIFTFFDLVVDAGPRKGLKFKGPLSFIYVLERDSWTEARGLMKGEDDGSPRLMVWKRISKE